MHVRVRGEEVRGRRARDLRAAALLRGVPARPSFTEAPDITARICGICPVAYQMSASHAIEDAFGVEVAGRDPRPAAADLLRRVDREPRAARLHAARARLPRLRERASRWPGTTARSWRGAAHVKKAGNELIALVGGREVHPVNVRVGGFYRRPPAGAGAPARGAGAGARSGAREAVGWVAKLPLPDFEHDYEFVALRHARTVPDRRRADGLLTAASTSRPGVRGALRGGAASSTRTRFTPACGARHLPRRADGPLQRSTSTSSRPGPRGSRGGRPRAGCRNPFQSIVVRAVEILYASTRPCA